MKTQFITKVVALSIILSSIAFLTQAQAPNIQWQKTIGGSGDEGYDGQRIIKLNDGNYLTFGGTTSIDADFSGITNKGGYDGFIIKTNAHGNILWVKTYGGTGDDFIYSVIENPNGNFTLLGNTTSNDGDVNGNHGNNDVWLMKLTSNGNIISSRCYGGSEDDEAISFVKGNGNSFVIAGYSNSNDGDLSGNHGDYDGWAFQVGQNGNIGWSKLFGGSNFDEFYSIVKTNDGKFIFGGDVTSTDGDAIDTHGGQDAFVVNLSQNGNKIWSVCHGGSGDESTNAAILTQDGNVAFTLFCTSTDGDAIGNNNGTINAWTYKMDVSTGAIIWETFSGTSTSINIGFNIISAQDGGFLVIGATLPNDSTSESAVDEQALKIDANGNNEWIKNFGGSDEDEAVGAITTSGGFLIICTTLSHDGDITNYYGGDDIWMVQLDDHGSHSNHRDANENLVDNNFSLNTFPNPFSSSTTISFSLSQPENASLKVFDLTGRLLKTLADGSFTEGENKIEWHVQNGEEGIYFLRFESENYSETKKVFIAR